MSDIEFNFPEREPPTPTFTLAAPSAGRIEWMKRNVRLIGGVILTAVCRPRGMEYPSISSVRSVMVNSCGCGNDTLVLVPYEDRDGVPQTCQLCLVCDGGAAWPRLEGEEAVPSAEEPPPFAEHPRWLNET